MEASNLAAAARLFAPSSLKELGRRGRSRAVGRVLGEAGLLSGGAVEGCLGDLYDTAFARLQRQYRNEYVYRAALAHKILLGRHSLNTAVMLNEFRVGESKADVVILNGSSTVYEIKSERDSLARLPSQVASYRRAFARVNVIASEAHVDEIRRAVPSDVGILTLAARGSISTVREAREEVGRIEPLAVFDCLQAREAEAALTHAGVTVPAVENTRRYSVLRDLFAQLAPKTAHSAMMAALKRNRSQSLLRDVICRYPRSVQPAVLAIRLGKAERERLWAAMNTRVAEVKGWS